MDESRSHGAVDPGGQPKRQENSAGAGSAPEAPGKREMVDRWGEVHSVTWDAERKMWAGPVQGTGLDGQPLRAWWPEAALKPFPLGGSGADPAPAPAISERATIPADEIPF